MDRKEVLLRAACDLLKKQEDAYEVLDILYQTVHYDDAHCDGSCLMDDIANLLGIDRDG